MNHLNKFRKLVQNLSPSPLLKNVVQGSQAACLHVHPVLHERQMPGKKREILRTRDFKVSWEESAEYIQSDAFKETYGDKPVWFNFRRNGRGTINVPMRLQCIKAGYIKSSNPCPICRDEFLVLDYRNVELLKHFIDPERKTLFESSKINVCGEAEFNLKVAVEKAQMHGYLSFFVPHRTYDYTLYTNSK